MHPREGRQQRHREVGHLGTERGDRLSGPQLQEIGVAPQAGKPQHRLLTVVAGSTEILPPVTAHLVMDPDDGLRSYHEELTNQRQGSRLSPAMEGPTPA
jgi:hypothetical protein